MKERVAIGLLELSSVASGIQATDIMLKAAGVDLMLARTICSGKYMVLVAGEVGAVRSSVQTAENEINYSLIDSFIIPNVHPLVFKAMAGHVQVEKMDALGIVESFSVASLIEGADAAVKMANVQLMEIRLAMALGGKAFFTVTGDVAAVRSAVDAAVRIIANKGLLVNDVVIANPRPELMSEMV
jgi:microcompartment protein CcmL/EutN